MSPDTATTHQRDPRTAPRPPPGHSPRRWALAALAAAVVAAACSGTESGAEAGTAQAGGDELNAGGERGTERERMLLESLGQDPDVDTVEPDCDGSEAPAGDEDTVRLCFVAFGDPSFDGSGPDKLIEGVRITVAAGYQSRTDGEKWWKSVHGPAWFAGGGSEEFSIHDLRRGGLRVELWPGEMVRSTPEGVAGAEVPFVVTGADGTASVTVQRHEPYQFCAVHPDDAGLVAGCGEFDEWFDFADEQPANAYGHSGIPVVFSNSSEPQRSVFVYFSRGRAFYDLDLDSGRYGRFLAGDTHPPGTGKVTHTGFMHVMSPTFGQVKVPLGGDRPWTVAVVKDEDIGEFFEAVSDGWFEQLDFESPPTWAPATLLRTGPDGTATADLDAGDYLFCTPNNTDFSDCTYEDVTAGQHRILYRHHRILYRHIVEGRSWLVELDRANSVALIEVMAACDTPQATVWCRSRERYEKARQHLQDTGDWPENWS